MNKKIAVLEKTNDDNYIIFANLIYNIGSECKLTGPEIDEMIETEINKIKPLGGKSRRHKRYKKQTKRHI